MSKAEEDYRIWRNDNFIVEATIDMSLWNKKIIKDFQENLSKVLTEIYKKSDIIFSNSKKSISLSFSGDKRIIELNYFYRKLSSATNVLSFPSHSKSKNTTFLDKLNRKKLDNDTNNDKFFEINCKKP